MNDSLSSLFDVDRLTAGYRGRPVLHEVTFSIEPGQVWFLVGPNGAGKSTLLFTLLGLLPAIEGRVKRHPIQAHPRRIGFVPQHAQWPETLPTTVREFVELGRTGLTSGDHRAAVEGALHAMGLEELAERDYRALSGGQRQRALVARALARRPGLLILDEPTASLDRQTVQSLLDQLLRLNRDEGLTLIAVTHDWNIARECATHAAQVSAGRVRAGQAGQVLSEEPPAEKPA